MTASTQLICSYIAVYYFTATLIWSVDSNWFSLYISYTSIQSCKFYPIYAFGIRWRVFLIILFHTSTKAIVSLHLFKLVFSRWHQVLSFCVSLKVSSTIAMPLLSVLESLFHNYNTLVEYIFHHCTCELSFLFHVACLISTSACLISRV